MLAYLARVTNKHLHAHPCLPTIAIILHRNHLPSSTEMERPAGQDSVMQELLDAVNKFSQLLIAFCAAFQTCSASRSCASRTVEALVPDFQVYAAAALVYDSPMDLRGRPCSSCNQARADTAHISGTTYIRYCIKGSFFLKTQTLGLLGGAFPSANTT